MSCLMRNETAVETWNRDLYKIPHEGQLLKKITFIVLVSFRKENAPLRACHLEKYVLFAIADATLFHSGDF